MPVVGYPIAACRGRLGLLAGLIVALAVLGPASASASTTARAKGLDVSNWNGAVKWASVASAGYRFAFGKATEGTRYVDATYATNRNGSEAAGLVFGAYHFARPGGGSLGGATASAIAQADHFLAVASPQPGELPPVLDLETTGKLSKTRLLAWTLAWLEEVYARTGVEPFVYTSPLFWSRSVGNSTAAAEVGTRLWIAHWTKATNPLVPAQNWNGTGWTFWQWTNCVSVSGMKHCADADRMNGASPAAVAIAPYPTGPPLLSAPPTIAGAPAAGQLLAAVPGDWEGGKPLKFSYRWNRCDAAGANCTAITGATAESYRPVSADVGHALEVVATATSASGSATAVTPPTAAVSPAGTNPAARPTSVTPPQIAGTAQVGQILAASVGAWTGAPKTFAYRWRRCNAAGVSCVAIPHAVGSRYTLTPDDVGSTLSLVVTATGPGGSTSATTAATGVVVVAPLPPISIGAQTAKRGVAGNLQTADGRAVVTWQPGAVHVGRIVHLDTFTGSLNVPGSEVALSVPGLRRGFKWPLDLEYTQQQATSTVLGYSTNGKVYNRVPPLQLPQLPVGTAVGWYVDSNNLTHVLTRTPFEIAMFKRGGWGDPTYTSANGPALSRQVPLEALPHPSDHSVVLAMQVGVHSQARITASVLGAGGRVVPILGSGSRLGVRLRRGTYRIAQAYRPRPGAMAVRLRLSARGWRAGSYRLRFVALDPWGRRSVLTLRFRYP
ncbi:MAG TPA: GH25 family lysozyme [Gaiellaceae bacterium]|nr:GH25 family lysozyme [Gaiellaceae bacterium]